MTIVLGVLISGRGSNLDALLNASVDARVAVVISNNPEAGGLAIATHHGIDAIAISPADYPDRAAYEAVIVATLQRYGVEWVVLAGYMKLVGNTMIRAYPNRMINIHPSLLPAFKGLDAQAQALAAGVSESGCTVHIVTAKMDDGPILGQARVPVLPDDTVERLTQRILAEEHRLLPSIIQQIALERT